MLIFSRQLFESVACTLTDSTLHPESESANILKTCCTLIEGALHPRSKSGNIFKSKSANILKLLVH